jgi:mono/diheme cytochrome c family protein
MMTGASCIGDSPSLWHEQVRLLNLIMKRLLFISLGVAIPALAQEKVDFARDIAPVFRTSCIECHGPEKPKAGLRLDMKEPALKGGKNGAVIKAGDAAGSELYRRITLPPDDVDIMPSEGDPLTKAQQDLIKAWIDEGANWPDEFKIEATAAEAEAPSASTDSQTAAAADPVLPGDFKPGPAEDPAIAALAEAGIDVRPLAQNTPWREANFRLLGTNVTDETIAPLKDITSLTELNLASTRITDAGLTVLKGLPYLTRLHLELTGVTDRGLAEVAALTNLVYLNLYGTPVTDAGLSHLHGLKHLKRLYVWQSQVTTAGASELEKVMPWLDVNTGWDLASLTNAPPKIEEEKKESE